MYIARERQKRSNYCAASITAPVVERACQPNQILDTELQEIFPPTKETSKKSIKKLSKTAEPHEEFDPDEVTLETVALDQGGDKDVTSEEAADQTRSVSSVAILDQTADGTRPLSIGKAAADAEEPEEAIEQEQGSPTESVDRSEPPVAAVPINDAQPNAIA